MGPLGTHNAAVLLVIHLLHLQTVRLYGTGWVRPGSQWASVLDCHAHVPSSPCYASLFLQVTPREKPYRPPGSGPPGKGWKQAWMEAQERGTRGMRHSSGRVQRPEGLRNSKAIRFKPQETLWGLEGMAQWDSTCLAHISYLKNRKWLKPNPKILCVVVLARQQSCAAP